MHNLRVPLWIYKKSTGKNLSVSLFAHKTHKLAHWKVLKRSWPKPRCLSGRLASAKRYLGQEVWPQRRTRRARNMQRCGRSIVFRRWTKPRCTRRISWFPAGTHLRQASRRSFIRWRQPSFRRERWKRSVFCPSCFQGLELLRELLVCGGAGEWTQFRGQLCVQRLVRLCMYVCLYVCMYEWMYVYVCT